MESHGRMNHRVSSCISFMVVYLEVLSNQTSINSPIANYYSVQKHFGGQVNSDGREKGAPCNYVALTMSYTSDL